MPTYSNYTFRELLVLAEDSDSLLAQEIAKKFDGLEDDLEQIIGERQNRVIEQLEKGILEITNGMVLAIKTLPRDALTPFLKTLLDELQEAVGDEICEMQVSVTDIAEGHVRRN